MYERLEKFQNEDEWKSWGHWLKNTGGQVHMEHKESTWAKLLGLLRFVELVACSAEFNRLNGYLFIPLQTMWNRKVDLIVQEIILANDQHVGRWTQEREDLLSREWKISGLNRSRETGRGRGLGNESNPQTLRGEGVEAD